MSNLNQRISNWRTHLAQTESLDLKVLDELEDHLRSSIADLTNQSLSEDEALDVALRRTGHAQALDEEFTKVNRTSIWARRAQWMIAGYLVSVLAGWIMTTAGNLAISLAYAIGFRGGVLVGVHLFAMLIGLSLLITLVFMLLRNTTSNRIKLGKPKQAYLNARRATAMGMAFLALTLSWLMLFQPEMFARATHILYPFPAGNFAEITIGFSMIVLLTAGAYWQLRTRSSRRPAGRVYGVIRALAILVTLAITTTVVAVLVSQTGRFLYSQVGYEDYVHIKSVILLASVGRILMPAALCYLWLHLRRRAAQLHGV